MTYPDSFLEKLIEQQHRTVYARITALSIDELPIECIEGRITSGSISVDGDSAVRRTCQLSLVSEQIDISNYLWGIDTKIKLEIGIDNYVDNSYPEVIWFKQGIYVITSFSAALSTSSYTINISGKDKMCMLNGENGGSLPFEVDFGNYEEIDAQGNTRLIKNPLKDIIREAVHHYGGEPFHNIVINDLDDIGKELQEYKLDTPMYLLRRAEEQAYIQGTLDGTLPVYINGSGTTIQDEDALNYDDLIGSDFTTQPPESTKFTLKDKPGAEEWCAAKIEYGQTMGYTPTEMTYAGDLKGAIGESITSVLDKIKGMLGNYEYFYDLDGRFIFQQKKNYLNTSWSPIATTDDGLSYIDSFAEKIQFSFLDNKLITAFNNTPNLSNLKNDFAVWGTRKSVSGKELPVHMRFAIDEKPSQYTSITIDEADPELKEYNKKYQVNLQGQSGAQYTIEEYDWRELIYRMARDYRRYGHLDSFIPKVIEANPDHFPTGITGYEQYYIDVEAFWRDLYDPDQDGKYVKVNNPIDASKTSYYYIKDGSYTPVDEGHSLEDDVTYYVKTISYNENTHFNQQVYDAPEQLNFWFDFLDSSGELAQYSVKKIGIRPKVVNDKDVKAIYYRETPQVMYKTEDQSDTNYTGYSSLQIPSNFKGMFSQSTQGKSAKDAVDNLLYNHAYCTESVSITSIPVYYLEPNRRIYIHDSNTGIVGEYIPTKFTIPLTYNGTMSITATKAVDRII